MKVTKRIVEVCKVDRIETLEISFKSRNADFVVSTSEYPCLDNFAVSFRIGPIGMSLRPDEAKTLGQAMIDASEHYKKVTGA